MAHTPGPWWVDPDYYGDVQCAKGEIASAFRWWNNGAEWEIRGAFATNDECRENARLIAAAPDLLGAAKAAGEWLSTRKNLHRDDEAFAVFSRIIAAVVKAEGQS